MMKPTVYFEQLYLNRAICSVVASFEPNANSTWLTRMTCLAIMMIAVLLACATPAKALTTSQLSGPWQATLFIDGGCGIGTKLVTFTLNSSGVASDAVGKYHTPQCGNATENGTLTIKSLNSSGVGTAQLNFSGTVFNFSIQVSTDGQSFNLADITDSGNYEEGTAIRASGAVSLSQLAGAWQTTLFIDGGCGIGTKLVTFALNTSGVASKAVATYHTPQCGDGQETGTFTIKSLNSSGAGTGQLDFSGTLFNFSLQVSPDAQSFNLADITDSGNYEEGVAIRQ